MIDAAEVDTLAAIELLIRLERRLPGTRCRWRSWNESQIIADHTVVRDRNRGGIGDKDALELRILDGKSGYHHLAKAGVVEAVHIDAVPLAGRVDNGVGTVGADQRKRDADNDVTFNVGSRRYLDRIARARGGNGLTYRREAVTFAGIYTQRGGLCKLGISADQRRADCHQQCKRPSVGVHRDLPVCLLAMHTINGQITAPCQLNSTVNVTS